MLTGIFMMMLGMVIWSIGVINIYKSLSSNRFNFLSFLNGVICSMFSGGLIGFAYGILTNG